MLASVRSAAVLGIQAYQVTVEVDVAWGLPQWTIVGMPNGAVRESRERVCAAVVNSGLVVPPRRVTVNLAPADRFKTGTAFDLPIALALLVATGQLNPAAVRDLVVIGELGLDGTIRSIRGALPVALALSAGDGEWSGGGSLLVVPPANVTEACLVQRQRVCSAATLRELVQQLHRGTLPVAVNTSTGPSAVQAGAGDYSEVVGQEVAKRAMAIAAAGGHNVLLVGPPGAGKSLLARRLPSILPPLDEASMLEVLSIHSVAGLLNDKGDYSPQPPFRAPHHSTSMAGLMGGGSVPRPGEVSLAHCGVLFLDELLEFPRYVLDSLRQPLEDGFVTIARAAGSVRYPARISLVAATNPCPCGRGGLSREAAANPCVCSQADVARYQARLSGPLADRLDLHVPVAPVPLAELGGQVKVASGTAGRTQVVPAVAEGRSAGDEAGGDSTSAAGGTASASMRDAVVRARERQRTRYAEAGNTILNSNVPGRWLDVHGCIVPEARALLVRSAAALGLSARGYHRTLRVARTIADLADEPDVTAVHVAEALRYRGSIRQ